MLPCARRHGPTSPATAIPARLAALRVGAQAEMQGFFFGYSAASFFACVFADLLSRVPRFRQALRDRAGKGEPFRQSLLAVCGRLAPSRRRPETTSARIRGAGSATGQQHAVTPLQPGETEAKQRRQPADDPGWISWSQPGVALASGAAVAVGNDPAGCANGRLRCSGR